MKRYLRSALVLGSFSVFGLVGCDDTAKTSTETKTTTPDGSIKVKETKEIDKSGTPPVEPATTPAPTPAPK